MLHLCHLVEPNLRLQVTSGGNALKFYSSVRLEIRRTGSVKQGDAIVGNAVRVKVAKNKLAPPFKQCHFDIEFGHGISRLGETIDHGVGAGVLTKVSHLHRCSCWSRIGLKYLSSGRSLDPLWRRVTWSGPREGKGILARESNSHTGGNALPGGLRWAFLIDSCARLTMLSGITVCLTMLAVPPRLPICKLTMQPGMPTPQHRSRRIRSPLKS